MDPVLASNAQLLAIQSTLVNRALQDLSEEDLWRRPNEHSNSIGWLLGHVTWARNGMLITLTDQPVFRCGASVSSCAAIVFISSAACWIDTPSRRRATAWDDPRPSAARNRSIVQPYGTRKSARCPSMVNAGGITPITERARVFVERVRPSTSDRPPRRVCQNSWLSTITLSRPSRSSSVV